MLRKPNQGPGAPEAPQNTFEDGIPEAPLSPATVRHINALKEREVFPTGRYEGDASNWRTYFGSLISNITATVETPEEKKYKSEAGQDLHMVAYYEVALERAAQAVNAIKAQIRSAPDFGRKAERVIQEEGTRALGVAVKKYRETLVALQTEQATVEGIYRRRMADGKAAASRAIEEGKRRAALFETEANTAETDLGSFQARRDAILRRLGIVEKPAKKQ